MFHTLAFEVQRSAGLSREEFLKDLCETFSISVNEARAGCFVKQNPLAIKIANVACILGTVNNKTTFEKIFICNGFLKNVFSADVRSAAVFSAFRLLLNLSCLTLKFFYVVEFILLNC